MVPCVCGRRFATARGMKIHRTKKGCAETCLSKQQRSATADKTSENQGQDENHSAEDIHAFGSDEDFVQALEARREKLHLPPSSAKQAWEQLEERIVAKLDTLLEEGTLSHKLDIFGDIIYATCRDNCGVKRPKEKKAPQKSRRQLMMENIRSQKKQLRKQIKSAPDSERQGLEEL